MLERITIRCEFVTLGTIYLKYIEQGQPRVNDLA
jgi:hypothetical protein